MKKIFKQLLGLASIASIAAGAVYYFKKKNDAEDDDFDDDFDGDFDDIDDEDSDDREYVTLDMEKEDGSKEEEAAQEADEEVTVKTEAETE